MYLKDFNLNAKKIIISLIIILAISLGLYLVALDNFCDQGEDFQQGICRFTILFPSITKCICYSSQISVLMVA
ncbi:PhoP/PhoQ regulator MgrB [Proteus mirabilis]|uniref:PhoP/PhoQ regulator MgrB n=1 Tax=Proteus mirabilis TaxID=584 RepID=UPI001CC069D6|nr:PhoP/PhoQ regulator MgrB [Proteus mirabilis]